MSRKAFKYSALLASVLLAAALGGCGSDSRDSGASLDSVAKVDEAKCAQCHSASVEPLTGDGIYAKYVGSTHQLNSVGCQDCHGGGAMHNGVGPLPYPDPTQGRCAVADCHGSNLGISKYAESRHAIGELEVSKRCNRCHTHQGAVLADQSGYTGDQSVIGATSAAAPANAPGDIPAADAQHIKCNTCHVTHKTEVLRTVSGWNPSRTFGATDPVADATQYQTCTSCHTYLNPDGTLVATGTTVGGVTSDPFYHYNRWYRMIASTHFDNPNTGVGLASNVIEGYTIRTKGADPCFDCHGHEMLTNTRQDETPPRPSTIYTDWAKSAHAGQLLAAKYTAAATVTGTSSAARLQQAEAVLAAGSIDDATVGGPAWVHYNWDLTFATNDTTVNSNDRGYCQKCHTSTGVSNYLDSPTTYVESGKNNNFSHLSGWVQATASTPTTPSSQNELLYCWGCHSDAGSGVLRNPGALTVTFDADKASPFTVTLPDAKKSNVCLACHTGRGNKDSVPVTRNGSAYHHGVAGGILFSSVTHTGFEFTGLNYANPSYFAHNTIGTSTADGSGPCAGCHMGGTSHSFKAVDAAAGTIVNQALCDTCHGGSHPKMTYATIEEESAGYQNAGLLLSNLIANTVTNYLDAAVLYTSTGNDYIAFQNSKLVSDEKGGFVHNRYYVKRLIFDSIDWLDNGVLDGTITIPVDYSAARTWFAANATTGVATRP